MDDDRGFFTGILLTRWSILFYSARESGFFRIDSVLIAAEDSSGFFFCRAWSTLGRDVSHRGWDRWHGTLFKDGNFCI